MTKTDTPTAEESSVAQTQRTDAATFEVRTNTAIPMVVVASAFAKQLERELNKSKSDAEFQFARVEYAKELLFESKTEVARIQSQLNKSIEIAEEFRQVKGLHYQCNCNMCNKLSELKKELK